MKFGFVTCVQLGKSCMEAIYQVGGRLDLVISLEDTQAVNKSGRIYLNEFCTNRNIPLLNSSNINNDECIEAIKEFELDWLFIIGWSQIAKVKVLSAPNKGVLGIHPTLLPQGRGRAAIPWAIIKGLKHTGVTLFKLDAGVDTGEIIEQQVIPLSDNMTATKLYQLVDSAHVELIKSVFPLLENDNMLLKKQDHSKATEWPERGPEDGEINIEGSVIDAEKLVRAITKPYPGAFVKLDGVKCIIWESEILKSKSFTAEKSIKFKDGILILKKFELIKSEHNV